MLVDATTPADVRRAVLAARTAGLPFAVYATGHGGAMPDPGAAVVVTTARMGGVRVDPGRRTAWVGPGTRWGEVLAAAAPFGLAPLSGSSPDVGVIGYTLGGGMSWLSRRFGLAADSVVRARVVTADGELRTVDADHEPDLFWALRGAGANFAAVTGLEFRLHPVTTVHAGSATFPLDRAAEVLTRYRDAAVPDALTANVLLTPGALVVRGVYAGPAQDARRALAPLWHAAGTPVRDDWRTAPYATTAVGVAGPVNFSLHRALTDRVVAAALDAVRTGGAAVEVRLWGGAIARADAGPAGHRDVPFSITVEGPDEVAAPVLGLATGGSFPNSLRDPSRVDTAYTAADHARLRELKGVHDPDNVFGLAKNIAPAPRYAHR